MREKKVVWEKVKELGAGHEKVWCSKDQSERPADMEGKKIITS